MQVREGRWHGGVPVIGEHLAAVPVADGVGVRRGRDPPGPPRTLGWDNSVAHPDAQREAEPAPERGPLATIYVEHVSAAGRVRPIALRIHVDAGTGDARDRVAERPEKLGDGARWSASSQPARAWRRGARRDRRRRS